MGRPALSREIPTEKSPAVTEWEFFNASMTDALLLRVRMPRPMPRAFMAAMSSSAPSLGTDARAAASSKPSRMLHAFSRSPREGSASMYSMMGVPGGQPRRRRSSMKSMASGRVRVPSKSKRTAEQAKVFRVFPP